MSRTIFSAIALAGIARAVNPVTVQGQNFVDSVTGGRFDIIGIDYQPGGEAGFKPDSGMDVLTNGTQCLRDAALMQLLGINTIRTYNVDPSFNHDECASIFNAAGIYMLIDVNTPLYGGNIDRSRPNSTYTIDYLKHIFQTVDNFRGYDNTLGFFSANELVNDNGGGNALSDPPFIRAVTRDLKQYIKARGGRYIPVGYGSTDNDKIILDMIQYIQCASSSGPDARSDFFGLNDYQWCGNAATFQSSGFELLTEQFSNITMPVFFSEYGCNKAKVNNARTFTEIPTIYGPQMTVFSGGLVYQWTQEEDDYGLVQINDNGTVSLLQDYNNLRARYASLNLKLIEDRNTTAVSIKPPTCSSSLITHPDLFSNSFTLPAQPSGASNLIKNGAGGRTGAFVTINSFDVPVAVYNTTGQQLKGLRVNATSTGNSPAAAGGDNHKGAAASLSAPTSALLGLLGLMMFVLT